MYCWEPRLYGFPLTKSVIKSITSSRTTLEENLVALSIQVAEKYIQAGEFAHSRMLAKVEVPIQFAQSKAKCKAVIASLEKAPEAIMEKSGPMTTK